MTTRHWFITGASKGIGRLLTETLLQRGDTVFATMRDPRAMTAMKALAADHTGQLHVAQLDVTDTRATHRVVDEAFAQLGRIDVIVSNAGYGLFGAAEEVTDTQITTQINTNVIGSVQVMRAALPHLRAQGGGRILQVSSEGGQLALPNFSVYHLTKWGIEGFVEAMAQEVKPFNIEVTLVELGPTRTEFAASMVSPAPMADYEHTPAGEMRRAIAAGSFAITGDARKCVRAMIDSAAASPAPRRLVLGAGSYDRIRAVLVERIAALDAQKEIACSVEIDA